VNDSKGTILWVDDEIDLLKPHIFILKERGYAVDTATNGEDAVQMIRENVYDLVFLDEMMPGMGGLETLSEIKNVHPFLPVVMVTKNEAETLMEDAIGRKISDYLTKPVNPSQILLTCKKFLERKRIRTEHVTKNYFAEFGTISQKLAESPTAEEWVDIYAALTNSEIELDAHPELGLHPMLFDQKREANAAFGRFIESSYRNWIESDPGKRPVISPDVVSHALLPLLDTNASVFFFVIDCLRLDQWLGMESVLQEDFAITKEYYYALLPTATPYARNAIFSGLFPIDIEKRFPELWGKGEDDEHSRNLHEHEFLVDQLQRRRLPLKPEPRYVKILDAGFGRAQEKNIVNFSKNKLTAIVVNFVDMLAHSRSDIDILKEIAPNEAAYRSLTMSWFNHSWLLGMFRTIARQKNVKVLLTTDHGSIRVLRGSKVIADRDASTNLRYKFGRNLKIDEKQAIFVKDPKEYRLPRRLATTNYVIAKEDYYFVYPTDYHRYLNQYRDTFQHGGISMEEVILPIVTMEPR